MARTKKLDVSKVKATITKATGHHADFKERIKIAINEGEHKSAEAAIKILTKSRDNLNKMIENVESHLEKKRPKA